MDPYAILGANPDDSPELLKKKYRKKAQKAHPDAGGSSEAFYEVQAAYEILSDPNRKALFEAGGTGLESNHEQAIDSLESVFEQLLDSDLDIKDYILEAYKVLDFQQREHRKTRIKCISKIKKANKKFNRVKVKGQNHFLSSLRKWLKVTELEARKASHAIKVIDIAKELLSHYRDIGDDALINNRLGFRRFLELAKQPPAISPYT